MNKVSVSIFLFVLLTFTASCKPDHSEEFKVKLQTLLEGHLSNPESVNLVIRTSESKIMLQFMDHQSEKEIQIVGHENLNNLKNHFRDIEVLLTKQGLTFHYGSTKNVLYSEFTKDQISGLVNFAIDFFRAEFVNADLSQVVYSYGFLNDRGTEYSENYNLLEHGI